MSFLEYEKRYFQIGIAGAALTLIAIIVWWNTWTIFIGDDKTAGYIFISMWFIMIGFLVIAVKGERSTT